MNEPSAAELLQISPTDLTDLFPNANWDGFAVLDNILAPSDELERHQKQFSQKNISNFLDNELKTAGLEMVGQLRTSSGFSLNYVHLHLGPTNSGKTYDSLAALADHGSGVYAGPLRMLAREAYEKLCVLAGEDNVGLVTGEEKINVNAPIIAATTEAAPLSGNFLVLDEAHWLSDRDRGWAWTRLLLAGQFPTMHIISDVAAETLITSLVRDAVSIDVTKHNRLTALTFKGSCSFKQLPAKTAVVAFSRKAVLALAHAFELSGRPAAVLYGALPVEARRAQIDRLISGEVDIICTTDVIGHGINLPINAVALAETNKFDGVDRRSLFLWEAAQIVGRAGRFGYGSDGEVFVATGLPWMSASSKLVSKATSAAAGQTSTLWQLHSASLVPTLAELNVVSPDQIVYRLSLWKTMMGEMVKDYPVSVSSTETILNKTLNILAANNGLGACLPVEKVWRLATCPVDDMQLITAGAAALTGSSSQLQTLVKAAFRRTNHTLEAAEAAAAFARSLRALISATGNLEFCTYEDALALEEKTSKDVIAALKKDKTVYGVCKDCKKPCPPWFTHCDHCHRQNYQRNNWYYGEYYDDDAW